MKTDLDERLVYFLKRKPRKNSVTPEQCIAINLFWRRGVKAPILARAFGLSKNTIYYRALTGEAESYPTSAHANSAADTNAFIDKLGVQKAWKTYVTQAMIDAVNREQAAELGRRAA
jgi:hypothetical protein